jgi:hypothetical protein
MDRLQLTFLLLVLTQAAHSLEEYAGHLYEVFLPARTVSGLISSDLRQGFIIFNVSLAVFGVCCLVWLMRRRASAVGVLWVWVAIELVNGIGHPAWSLVRGGYTPGVATAPVLLCLAVSLARQLAVERTR